MSTDMKRFTISITPDIEQGLNKLKKEQFYDKAQSEMVRYLIKLGLNFVSSEQIKHQNKQGKT